MSSVRITMPMAARGVGTIFDPADDVVWCPSRIPPVIDSHTCARRVAALLQLARFEQREAAPAHLLRSRFPHARHAAPRPTWPARAAGSHQHHADHDHQPSEATAMGQRLSSVCTKPPRSPRISCSSASMRRCRGARTPRHPRAHPPRILPMRSDICTSCGSTVALPSNVTCQRPSSAAIVAGMARLLRSRVCPHIARQAEAMSRSSPSSRRSLSVVPRTEAKLSSRLASTRVLARW